MIRYLSLDDLLAIIDELGLGPLRDIGLLDAARQRPMSSAWGEDAYPDLHTKAAIMESIGRNHALVDGNKRLCWAAGVVFLPLNGSPVEAPFDDAHDLVVGICTGRVGIEESARALLGWSVGG